VVSLKILLSLFFNVIAYITVRCTVACPIDVSMFFHDFGIFLLFEDVIFGD
jgi:hypothetical protein